MCHWQGETKTGIFQMTRPGLFVYHCAAAPVPTHIMNGMYGLLLVEPKQGLPRADKEFYVMQSEFYGTPSDEDPSILEPSFTDGLMEVPPRWSACYDACPGMRVGGRRFNATARVYPTRY